jgi:hypothetical protein
MSLGYFAQTPLGGRRQRRLGALSRKLGATRRFLEGARQNRRNTLRGGLGKAVTAALAKYTSRWPGSGGYGPDGANARPRSATVMAVKNDGARVGT